MLREDALGQDLPEWIGSVRQLMQWMDSVLNQLEELNLRETGRAPAALERRVLEILEAAEIAVDRATVQHLLDGVLAAQEMVLAELNACKSERLRGARQGVSGGSGTTGLGQLR